MLVEKKMVEVEGTHIPTSLNNTTPKHKSESNNNNDQSEDDKNEDSGNEDLLISDNHQVDEQKDEGEEVEEYEDSEEDDSDEEQVRPETVGGGGVIPDILLNELEEILILGEGGSEDEDFSNEEDDGESWKSNSPVEGLEAIPEEEEWDSGSDSTLTELSIGHVHHSPQVSTQTSSQPSIRTTDTPPSDSLTEGHTLSPGGTGTLSTTLGGETDSPPKTLLTLQDNTVKDEEDQGCERGESILENISLTKEVEEAPAPDTQTEAQIGLGTKGNCATQTPLNGLLKNLHNNNNYNAQKARRKSVKFEDSDESELKISSALTFNQSVSLLEGEIKVEKERVFTGPASEYFVVKLLAAQQQRQLDLVDLSRLNIATYESGRELSKFIEANTAGSYFSESDNNNFQDTPTQQREMHQRLSSSCSEHQHLPPGVPREKPRGVLRKTGNAVKKSGRNVSFNETLNLFYEAECQCWIHEEDYARLRHEEQLQQQMIYEQATQIHQLHHHHPHHGHYLPYDPPPLEFEDTPTLSPPEGYKDRFFPQVLLIEQQHQNQQHLDPDVTRVSPPSPPAARRKVFLKENSTEQPGNHTHHRPILNGLEEDEDEDSRGKKSSRFGGILKGGRLWRSNSSDSKKVSSPDEPDLVKCTERIPEMEVKTPPTQHNQSQQVEFEDPLPVIGPTKVSTGTATLRTSEQIRLAVDSTLRISRSKKNKQECSSLVEKLRWLTSLDDEDSDSQSGFATWPSRDKNGALPPASTSSSTSSSRKSDAGTSTSEEFVHPSHAMRHPVSASEAKIKQISYTLEDIDEGLKGGENELETFITEDGGRIERIRRRYGEDVGGDDYGFSRRPSVKGIKPKFSSTNQIFAQFTRAGAETPIPQMMQIESQYENTRPPSNSHYEPLPPNGGEVGLGGSGARVNLNYDQYPSNPPPTSNSSIQSQQQPQVRAGNSNDESRSHFEMIRNSFEQASFVSYNRPHSWSVSTLPHTHTHNNPAPSTGHIPLPGMTNNLSGSALNIPSSQGQVLQQNQQQQMGNMPPGMMNGGANGGGGARPNSMPMMGPLQQQQMYGTMPSQGMVQQQVGPGGQPIYGTVRRVPNVIGRPLFLHYGALSTESHPKALGNQAQPYPPAKAIPETPSPTQPQQPPAPINSIKYYGPPIRYYNPPPPVPPRSATTSIASGGPDCERGNPEGATDEDQPSIKEPYSMNV